MNGTGRTHLPAKEGSKMPGARDSNHHTGIDPDLPGVETRFESFANLASDWFWETDADHRYVLITDSVRQYNGGADPTAYYGMSRWEVGQQAVQNFNVSAEDWERHLAQLEAHEPFRDFVYEFCDIHGEAHYWSISGEPLFDRGGRFLGYRGVGKDITQRVELEKTLRLQLEELTRQKTQIEVQAAELLELNALKNRFLAIAAHDLRNPMGAISGFSEALLTLDLGEAKRRDYLSSIHDVSRQMLTLLNDLLDISTIESGALAVEMRLGDLSALMRERLDLVKFEADAKNISIETDLQKVPDVRHDPDRMRQAFDNLLTNAIKYSPPGSVIHVSAAAEDGAVAVSVQDEGPGIPEDEFDLLFAPLVRLSTTATAGEKSTGLGTTIVKMVVDAHGGDIRAENIPGSGARFTIVIPVPASTAEG